MQLKQRKIANYARTCAYIKIVLETRQVSHRNSSTIANSKQNFPIVLEFRYVPLGCKVLKREAK